MLIASPGLLIGEPSQAAQVTPIGARPVTAVGVGQRQLLRSETAEVRTEIVTLFRGL